MLAMVVDQDKYNPKMVMGSRSSYVQSVIQCDSATRPNRQSPTPYFANAAPDEFESDATLLSSYFDTSLP